MESKSWSIEELASFADCESLGDIKASHKEEDICSTCSNGHVCTVNVFKSGLMGEALVTVSRCLLFSPS